MRARAKLFVVNSFLIGFKPSLVLWKNEISQNTGNLAEKFCIGTFKSYANLKIMEFIRYDLDYLEIAKPTAKSEIAIIFLMKK